MLPCFVNPRNQKESALFREISSLGFIVPLIAALIFFLVPLAAHRTADTGIFNPGVFAIPCPLPEPSTTRA